MVSNTMVIGLAFLELGKFFSWHALWSQFFGLCDLGAQKRNAKKLSYAVKGIFQNPALASSFVNIHAPES